MNLKIGTPVRVLLTGDEAMIIGTRHTFPRRDAVPGFSAYQIRMKDMRVVDVYAFEIEEIVVDPMKKGPAPING